MTVFETWLLSWGGPTPRAILASAGRLVALTTRVTPLAVPALVVVVGTYGALGSHPGSPRTDVQASSWALKTICGRHSPIGPEQTSAALAASLIEWLSMTAMMMLPLATPVWRRIAARPAEGICMLVGFFVPWVATFLAADGLAVVLVQSSLAAGRELWTVAAAILVVVPLSMRLFRGAAATQAAPAGRQDTPLRSGIAFGASCVLSDGAPMALMMSFGMSLVTVVIAFAAMFIRRIAFPTGQTVPA